MYAQLKAFSVLAIAGTAIAAPQGWGNWGQGKWWGGDNDYDGNRSGRPAATATEVAVVTAYTTVYGNGAKPTEAPVAPSPAPAAPSPEPAAPSPEPGHFYERPSSAAPSAPAASAPASDSGSNDGYMGIVSTWRSNLGMSALSEDGTLAANALKTAADGNGQMVHQLNSGSMAQVLAPGSADEFEKVFVGGWLCEIPSLPGLDGVCSSMSAGWDYQGQTGHAEILTSGSYSKIGCGNAGGIWACDLA